MNQDLESVLARIVESAPRHGRALVAIDGVGASGKTAFAAALAEGVHGREVVTVHVDDFFNPAAIRHARGRYSPEGFWLDTYNYAALTSLALDPLRAKGDGWYRGSAFDHTTGQQLTADLVKATADALVLVEGTFLHRDCLVGYWDSSVFLDVSFAVAADRMAVRGGAGAELEGKLLQRYFGAQRLYFESSRPWERATLVVEYADLAYPRIIPPSTARAATESMSPGA